MSESHENGVEARHLRFLRRLVTVLTAVMIVGVIAIVVLLVIRLTAAPPPLALPDEIALPEGAEAEAVTVARGGFVVLTSDDRVLVYARDGTLRGETRIAP